MCATPGQARHNHAEDVGGGQQPVRPNYGKDTLMVDWLLTAWNWECNDAPRIRVAGTNDRKILEQLLQNIDPVNAPAPSQGAN